MRASLTLKCSRLRMMTIKEKVKVKVIPTSLPVFA